MTLSARLLAVVDALPLRPGMRVLEVGGAPGAAAREVAARVGSGGHVLVLDRSATGIAQIESNLADEMAAGIVSTLCAKVESFDLPPGTEPLDLAFACRVGALDGRFPALHSPSLDRLRAAVRPGGSLFVDTGSPLTEIPL